MIPALNEHGFLPGGIHRASLDEIKRRFGEGSEIRRVQMESVRWMVDLARRAGAQRIILNGSFVTDIMEPNDVDCVILMGRGGPKDRKAENELRGGLPFLELALVRQRDFDKMVNVYFASDRHGTPKGMVEVIG